MRAQFAPSQGSTSLQNDRNSERHSCSAPHCSPFTEAVPPESCQKFGQMVRRRRLRGKLFAPSDRTSTFTTFPPPPTSGLRLCFPQEVCGYHRELSLTLYHSGPCIRGHRSSKCTHKDRVLIAVRKPGRPLSACPHGTASCQCQRVVQYTIPAGGSHVLYLQSRN